MWTTGFDTTFDLRVLMPHCDCLFRRMQIAGSFGLKSGQFATHLLTRGCIAQRTGE